MILWFASLQTGFPFPKPNVVSRLNQGEPWISDLFSSKDKDVSKGNSTGASPLPSKRERISGVEQDHWVFDDQKVVGVHWSYKETRTLLEILSQTEFYEAATETAKCMGL